MSAARRLARLRRRHDAFQSTIRRLLRKQLPAMPKTEAELDHLLECAELETLELMVELANRSELEHVAELLERLMGEPVSR